MYLSNRNNKRKIDTEDSDDVYYIHEFKRAHLVTSKATKTQQIPIGNEQQIAVLKPTPKFKLFDMCLRFIATNLENVETLVEFPSQIGVLLFNECQQINKFNADESIYALKCFKMFTTAYPDYLIESLNLNQQSKLLVEIAPIISVCTINKLDLSDCDLSTQTDFNLVTFLKESAHSLEYLNLSKNKIDETFIKKFTLPQRLNYTMLTRLKVLILSHNYKLKASSIIKHFHRYPKLNEIHLSQLKDDYHTESNTNPYKVCQCNTTTSDLVSITNSGWISNLKLESLISNKMQLNSTQGKYKK